MAMDDTDAPRRSATRPQRVPQPEIPSETRRLEVGCMAPPVVRGERRHAPGREAVGQQAGLHGLSDEPESWAAPQGISRLAGRG